MIPFVELPELPLSFLQHIPILSDWIDPSSPPSVKPFGTLVAMGVYIGSMVALRHARERGLDPKKHNDFILWSVLGAFIGAHVFDAIAYHPERVLAEPLYLLRLWEGLSSYGGFLGSLIGTLLWKWSRKAKVMPHVEMNLSVFPLAWSFGRAGCAVVHDHPGQLSDAWYAVQFPVGDGIEGRLDLGLIEFSLTVPLAIWFWWLWKKKPRPPGFFAGLICTVYAPVRFMMDFLRAPEGTMAASDPRYFGLTPAQWASFALLGVGIALLRRASRLEPIADYGQLAETEKQEAERLDEAEDQAEKADAETSESPAQRRKKKKKRKKKTPNDVSTPLAES